MAIILLFCHCYRQPDTEFIILRPLKISCSYARTFWMFQVTYFFLRFTYIGTRNPFEENLLPLLKQLTWLSELQLWQSINSLTFTDSKTCLRGKITCNYHKFLTIRCKILSHSAAETYCVLGLYWESQNIL